MELRQAVFKAGTVFCAVFLIPLGIFNFSVYSDELSMLAGFSAKQVMQAPDAAGKYHDNSYDLFPAAELNSTKYTDIEMALQETEPEYTSSEVPSPLAQEDVSGMIPYPEDLEDHDGVIESYNFGYYTGEQYFDLDDSGQVRNCTLYSNDELYALSKNGLPFELDKDTDEPCVLIYHTHATECFEPYARDFYDSDLTAKCTERDKNIISVGDKICEQLDAAGVPYIHDTLVHDYPSYDSAYQSSRSAVQEILNKYPSIKICLDIHRDGIEREDGTRIAPIADIDGRQAAQIMIISCADDGSGDLPDFRKNFSFACVLQSALESRWNGLTRPILFDTRFYNQDLSVGSLLIEVGSHGNSIDQAQYSGELIGKTLAQLFD